MARATLVEITAAENPSEVGDPLEVQFNPTSLRLTLTNTVNTNARTRRQTIGSSTAKLSLSLIYDTAEEGSTEEAVSALQRANQVTQFLEAKQRQGSRRKVPAKVRFQWGDFIFDGIIASVNQDMDLFAQDGTPLRCKVDFTIDEQKIPIEFLQEGPGADRAEDASEPEEGGWGAGTGGDENGGQPPDDSTANALDNESASDFLARQGADPAAWRSVASQFGDPTAAEAGAAIDFSAGVNASAGLGFTAGVDVGVNAGIDAAFGLTGATAAIGAVGASTVAGLEAGKILSAAGGLVAAVEAKAIAAITSATDQTLRAFGMGGASSGSATVGSPVAVSPQAGASAVGTSAPAVTTSAPVTPARPAPPDQPRPPLAQTGIPSRAQQQAAPKAPAPPKADARAKTFGFGAPLRPRVAVSGTGDAPNTRDPTVAPWVALPARSAGRDAADRAQAERLPTNRCGCTKPCTCSFRRGFRS